MLRIKPDDFYADGYGFTTNQTSHAVAIGFLGFVYTSTLFYFLLFGEFPYKTHIAAFSAIGYLVFELVTQGWKKWDTIEDWWFVNVYGVWGPLSTFSEVEVGSPKISADLFAPLPFIALLVVHLWAGSYVREKRKNVSN